MGATARVPLVAPADPVGQVLALDEAPQEAPGRRPGRVDGERVGADVDGCDTVRGAGGECVCSAARARLVSHGFGGALDAFGDEVPGEPAHGDPPKGCEGVAKGCAKGCA